MRRNTRWKRRTDAERSVPARRRMTRREQLRELVASMGEGDWFACGIETRGRKYMAYNPKHRKDNVGNA